MHGTVALMSQYTNDCILSGVNWTLYLRIYKKKLGKKLKILFSLQEYNVDSAQNMMDERVMIMCYVLLQVNEINLSKLVEDK